MKIIEFRIWFNTPDAGTVVYTHRHTGELTTGVYTETNFIDLLHAWDAYGDEAIARLSVLLLVDGKAVSLDTKHNDGEFDHEVVTNAVKNLVKALAALEIQSSGGGIF
ncbi:MAG: hypothetical protein KatS3mg087_0491 [Patescibacteria group bacterium]|nr:MAG: hypothetical protein KatS3mg087_0491 [Patescibacteria group bacterium]